jgi:membrane-bound lytic murein transglycosylase D
MRKNYDITNTKEHIENSENQPSVQKYVEQYSREEEKLQKITHQASPYLFYVIDQIEKRDLPGELALLPMIESAYLPNVTSPKGAAGLWQFIPGTGRDFGLKQNKWFDGRRDVKLSTIAALNYLESLHEEFGNDWMLALAAYNAGPGTVRKAIKKNLKKGLSTSFWALNLPKETREYVPKFLALAQVVGNPEKHDIDLPELDNKPYFSHVNTGKTQDIKKIAVMADMDLKELKRLNPAFKTFSTLSKGKNELLLPVANAEKLEYNLNKIKDKLLDKQL